MKQRTPSPAGAAWCIGSSWPCCCCFYCGLAWPICAAPPTSPLRSPISDIRRTSRISLAPANCWPRRCSSIRGRESYASGLMPDLLSSCSARLRRIPLPEIPGVCGSRLWCFYSSPCWLIALIRIGFEAAVPSSIPATDCANENGRDRIPAVANDFPGMFYLGGLPWFSAGGLALLLCSAGGLLVFCGCGLLWFCAGGLLTFALVLFVAVETVVGLLPFAVCEFAPFAFAVDGRSLLAVALVA